MADQKARKSLKEVLSNLPNTYMKDKDVALLLENFEPSCGLERPIMYYAEFLTYLEREAAQIMESNKPYLYASIEALAKSHQLEPEPKPPSPKERLLLELKKHKNPGI